MISQALDINKKKQLKKKTTPVFVWEMLEPFLSAVWLSMSYSPGGGFKSFFFCPLEKTLKISTISWNGLIISKCRECTEDCSELWMFFQYLTHKENTKKYKENDKI